MDQIILYLRECLQRNKQRYNRLDSALWKSSDGSGASPGSWKKSGLSLRKDPPNICSDHSLFSALAFIENPTRNFGLTNPNCARGKNQLMAC